MIHAAQQGIQQHGTSIMINIEDVIERFKIPNGEIATLSENITLLASSEKHAAKFLITNWSTNINMI